jgi:hypothetical protein
MTDFQKRIIAFLEKCPNRTASRWEIAQGAFPEKWTKVRGRRMYSGRAALIGHIDRAARKAGLIRFIPSSQYSQPCVDALIALRDVLGDKK